MLTKLYFKETMVSDLVNIFFLVILGLGLGLGGIGVRARSEGRVHCISLGPWPARIAS